MCSLNFAILGNISHVTKPMQLYTTSQQILYNNCELQYRRDSATTTVYCCAKTLDCNVCSNLAR
jgi:hypothetical protein